MTEASDTDLISDWCGTANYLALNMLYGRRYFPPGEAIKLSDIRDIAFGHWGCVPGLNFIMANLVTHSATTSTRIAPVIGTGHGAAAWVAWLLLNAADQIGRLNTDELDRAICGFGDESQTPHEMFGVTPGVLWPSGELGYALAVAQGAAPELADRVAVILGDGELETGCTLSGLAAGPLMPNSPLVVVNANGFRMGGPSWFARFSDHGCKLLTALGWRHSFVVEGDGRGFQRALGDPADRQPAVIVYLNEKGGSIPPFPGQSSTPGPVHKLPRKNLRSDEGRAWLRQWLDSFHAPLLSDIGLLLESNGGVARGICGISQVSEVFKRASTTANTQRESIGNSCVEVFAAESGRVDPSTLITSPDEASSNLVHCAGLEIREFLSEQLTFGWAVGAAAAGRPALWVSYEAFAPLVTTMVTQYARHLALCPPETRPRRLPCIVLTSLSFRNVASHQDTGFCADIERRVADHVAILVPHTLTFSADAARRAHEYGAGARTLTVVVADKYSIGPDESDACTSTIDRNDGWIAYRFGCASDNRPGVAILALGAVQFLEAARAAQSIIAMGISSACDVLVLYEIGPRGRVDSVVADLISGYDWVAAVAGMESLMWAKVLEVLRAAGRLVHNATFAPTPGPNDVARLFVRALDWLAIVISVGEALGADVEVDLVRAARARLQREVDFSRTTNWYYDLTWLDLQQRANLALPP